MDSAFWVPSEISQPVRLLIEGFINQNTQFHVCHNSGGNIYKKWRPNSKNSGSKISTDCES